MTPIGPITPEERINSLDTLRGFALLGILPANVLVFGMYFAAGNDPTVAGGATGLNLASWALFRILIEGKMRCLFSMAFGASMILLTSRVEERSGATAADIYYRRNLWLLLFGLAHAFLLFSGDILYPCFVCDDSVSVPEAPREEAPDHRRPVHRVQGRVVCRGRIPAARATEPSRRRRRCREGGQEAGRSAGGGEEGTGSAAETAKAFIRRAGEGRKEVARQSLGSDRRAGESPCGLAWPAVLRPGELRRVEHDVHGHGPVQTRSLQRVQIVPLIRLDRGHRVPDRDSGELVHSLARSAGQFRPRHLRVHLRGLRHRAAAGRPGEHGADDDPVQGRRAPVADQPSGRHRADGAE